MAVGADLPDIVAAEGNVASQRGFPVFIRRQNFQQPIGRDDAAVCCGQILSGIEAKGDGGHLLIHADTERLVLLQHLA